MNNTNLLHTLEVTQTFPGSPTYSGYCKTCKVPVKVVEVWAAGQAIKGAHNSGLKKGFIVGAISVGIVWCLSKLIEEYDEDKDQ